MGRRNAVLSKNSAWENKILLLALAIALFLSACGTEKTPAKTETTSSLPAAEDDRKEQPQYRECSLDAAFQFSIPSEWELFMEAEGDILYDWEDLFFEAKRLPRIDQQSAEDALDSVISVWA